VPVQAGAGRQRSLLSQTLYGNASVSPATGRA
jgi:hypothetical protein